MYSIQLIPKLANLNLDIMTFAYTTFITFALKRQVLWVTALRGQHLWTNSKLRVETMQTS